MSRYTKAELNWLDKSVSYYYNQEYRKPSWVLMYKPPRQVYSLLGGFKEIRKKEEENGG